MNTKQTVFVNEYLICWNSAEAARRAGYNGKSNVIGPRLLADVSIKAEIEARVKDLLMSADEALIRLSEHARGDLGEFADIQLIGDLKKHPKSSLVKKLTTDVYEDKNGKVHYKTHFELYDAQSALDKIMRYHGLYNDKVELSWRDKLPPDINPDEAINNVRAIMQQAATLQDKDADK